MIASANVYTLWLKKKILARILFSWSCTKFSKWRVSCLFSIAHFIWVALTNAGWSTETLFISGHTDQFSYQPSLLNAPDLPSWIHYTYSKKDHHGFLYGVAPKDQKYFQVMHNQYVISRTLAESPLSFYCAHLHWTSSTLHNHHDNFSWRSWDWTSTPTKPATRCSTWTYSRGRTWRSTRCTWRSTTSTWKTCSITTAPRSSSTYLGP